MRKNSGKTNGKYLGAVLDGTWSIYQTATGYRASSVAAIDGKANFSFALKDRKIDKHEVRDSVKLQEERPELYTAIEKFFAAADPEMVEVDSSDEYGDIARSQGKPYTPQQRWKRRLLFMRLEELEATAKSDVSFWDAGIRMTFSAIFKFKITDEEYEKAMSYITSHTAVNLQTLLTVMRDFYDGNYRPHSCQTLEKQLDLIAGDKNETFR